MIFIGLLSMTAFQNLASAYIYCTEKEEKINATFQSNGKLKVKIVNKVFTADIYPSIDYETFAKIDEALTKIFIVKAREIEEYSTHQEGRTLYCDLIVKKVVITGTSEGDGIFFIRNVNANGKTTPKALQINIAVQPN